MSINQPPRLRCAAGFITVRNHLKRKSVGVLRLYLLMSESGSPVIRGEDARPGSTPGRLEVAMSRTVSPPFQDEPPLLTAALLPLRPFFAAISSCAILIGSPDLSSPSGEGRGPIGIEEGLRSAFSSRRGRPSPALAQFTSWRTALRASATGDTRLSGGNMQALHCRHV